MYSDNPSRTVPRAVSICINGTGVSVADRVRSYSECSTGAGGGGGGGWQTARRTTYLKDSNDSNVVLCTWQHIDRQNIS